VRAALAGNRSVPFPVLAELAVGAEALVRRRAAFNRAARPALLDLLAGDGDPSVRGGAARHPAAAAVTHRRLLADPVTAVREALAGRSRHEDVLTELAAADEAGPAEPDVS
jgi:hypothetical protein